MNSIYGNISFKDIISHTCGNLNLVHIFILKKLGVLHGVCEFNMTMCARSGLDYALCAQDQVLYQ